MASLKLNLKLSGIGEAEREGVWLAKSVNHPFATFSRRQSTTSRHALLKRLGILHPYEQERASTLTIS